MGDGLIEQIAVFIKENFLGLRVASHIGRRGSGSSACQVLRAPRKLKARPRILNLRVEHGSGVPNFAVVAAPFHLLDVASREWA